MKPFKKIVAPTIQDIFMKEMITTLMSDEVKPGDKLPTERALAEQMGVSKTVIHNGFKELARMGFVEIRPQNGVYALDYMKHGNLDTFSAIVHYSNDNMDFDLVQCFIDTVLTIDNMTFKRFVEKPGNKAEEIKELNEEVNKIGIAMTDPHLTVDEKAQKKERFHYTLALHSGSAALPLMMNTIRSTSEIIWASFIRNSRTEDLINVPDRIVKALANNDADEAYSIMETTAGNFLQRIKHQHPRTVK